MKQHSPSIEIRNNKSENSDTGEPKKFLSSHIVGIMDTIAGALMVSTVSTHVDCFPYTYKDIRMSRSVFHQTLV
jgi:hypothetical protein